MSPRRTNKQKTSTGGLFQPFIVWKPHPYWSFMLSIDTKALGKVAVLMGGRVRLGGAGAPHGGDATREREVGRSGGEVHFDY